MERLKVAIVGCGSFGSQMADLLASLPPYEIVAACDPDLDRASAVSGKHGGTAFSDYAGCLAHSGADAVALFTPNHIHHPMALAAAAAGRHIFCEKPMAMNVAECHEMIEAAGRARVKLMVGHKRRLRPQYAKMAEFVRGGRYGRVLAVNINGFYRREAHAWWRRRATGGGLLPYSGVHDIDFMRHICGDAASVFARTPVKMNHLTDFEDQISVMIHFETGPVGTLEVCPFSPMLTFRQSFGVHIVFEHGGVLYEPTTMTVRAQGWDEPMETFSFDNEDGFRQAFTREFTSFADWVLRDAEPVLTGWDGLRCVEIMEAAELSAYSGKEVELPLPRQNAREHVFGPVSSQAALPAPVPFARGLSMAEGPAFDREGSLYVANCRADFVSRISPDGGVAHFVTTGGKTQGVAAHPDGSLLISDHSRKTIFRATADGELTVYCDRYADGTPLRGPNEIAFGPNGHLYFTDPGPAWRGRPLAALSRVGAHQKAEVLADGLEFSNGFDLDPAGEMIYVADSVAGRILRAPLAPDGSLAGPLAEFVRFEGRIGPDGLRFARSGNLYVTLFGRGQVAVVSPAGEIAGRIRVPGLFPTNCIFLGRDLLVCEGQTGAIWRIAVGEEGLPSYAQTVWDRGRSQTA
ncbi:MAG: SMP-30/gluconolactonase/LRE family protein [Bryobacteraceae bacterium]